MALWTREDASEHFWHFGRVSLSAFSAFQIIIDLTTLELNEDESIFGLDDIRFGNDFCRDSSDVNQVCTFSDLLMCDYVIKSSNFAHEWKLHIPNLFPKNDNKETSPLPIPDHTSGAQGSGYVYFSGTGADVGDSTILTRSKAYEPLEGSDPTRCLEFYYFLSGQDAIELNVFTNITSIIPRSLVWTRNNDHGSTSWWKGNVNIKLLTDYHILFEAVAGVNANQGLAALDDISLRNGPCSRFFFTLHFYSLIFVKIF